MPKSHASSQICSTAVSYTHLDVYKRQMYKRADGSYAVLPVVIKGDAVSFALPSISGPVEVVFTAASGVRQETLQTAKAPKLWCMADRLSFRSVSYTHLIWLPHMIFQIRLFSAIIWKKSFPFVRSMLLSMIRWMWRRMTSWLRWKPVWAASRISGIWCRQFWLRNSNGAGKEKTQEKKDEKAFRNFKSWSFFLDFVTCASVTWNYCIGRVAVDEPQRSEQALSLIHI